MLFSKMLMYIFVQTVQKYKPSPVLILNGPDGSFLHLVWLTSWALSLVWDSEMNIYCPKLISFRSLGKLLQFLYENKDTYLSEACCSVHNTATFGKVRKCSNINCFYYILQSSEIWPDRVI